MIYMKLFKNENGVSEIVGAMMILLILVLYLGVLQGYEVPKWNRELEKQEFDLVNSDFLNFRSGLEDASMKNFPRTISMHTGVRYPERFMLQNPGQGAYGTFTTYPLDINVSYTSNGTIYYANYTSFGLIYEMKGISDFPKIVYEHGIVIKDYGNLNYSEDVNHLTTEAGIYLPVVKDIEPINSLDVKALNIFPIPQYSITDVFSSMDVKLETRYPMIWAELPNESKPSGSEFIVSIQNRTINIKNIYGFDTKKIYLPNDSSASQNVIYSGIITFSDTGIKSVSGGGSSCASPGQYLYEKNQGCIDLPSSMNITQFIIKDIALVSDTSNAELRFRVTDNLQQQWEIGIVFGSDSNGNPITATVNQKKPPGVCGSGLMNGQIDLTSCYQAANINNPNALSIIKKDNGILHAKFLVS